MPPSLLLALAGSALLGACTAAPPPQTPAPLAGTYWRLTSVGDQPAVVADSTAEAHLRFAADSGASAGRSGRVSGATGCNQLSGPYTLDGAALRVGPAATTRMACVDPAVGAQEQALLAALAATTRHTITGDVLTLAGAGGPLARFTRTTPAFGGR